MFVRGRWELKASTARDFFSCLAVDTFRHESTDTSGTTVLRCGEVVCQGPTLPFCLPLPLLCITISSDPTPFPSLFLSLLVLGFPVDSLRIYSFELPLNPLVL